MVEATTPLEQIERSVQSRATSLSLDVDSDDGRARLKEMIDEAVLEWTAQHQRGQRQIALSDPDGVADRAFRNLARYGPLTELLG
ncbi:MAG: hypothetical protein WBA45_16735 [Microthrixaceae bacterium]